MSWNLFQIYLVEVKQIPVCTPEEEALLPARAKQGDQEARKRLLEGMLYYALELAGSSRNRGIPAADLVQEANMGLLLALEEYEEGDFRAQVEPVGIVMDDMDIHRTYRFPTDHPLILTLRKVYEELTGKDSTPSHEGGTYAQAVPNIVPFGSIFPGTPDLCHRPDESVDIDEYILDAKLFGNGMYALTQA